MRASASGFAAVRPSGASPEEVLAGLSPAQRVGQVLLVAFFAVEDSDAGEPDPLRDARHLVTDVAVGGVVLQKGNNVIRNERGRDLPGEVARLTGELQRAALGPEGSGVPLLVAVDHEGDGDPLTHLREGFTALPSAMAIGGTFDPAAAEAIGRVVGSELEAVGVNLLLGPVLDVLADPRVDSGGDIGTRAFGGDPYWVGRLGAAYVAGVHAGSEGRVATVAKHFPGHGGSDRSTDETVATVNKPLEALKDVELQPFAAVAGGVAEAADDATPNAAGSPRAPGGGPVTDGLMTSHIRYRAIHPEVRRVTPPISFDPEGLAALLAMPEFSFGAWRQAGGLVVADSLGVRAVRRWFDPSEAGFAHRMIARQALLAGNDVLILAQFAAEPAWSSMLANVEDTAAYFVEQYGRDPAFRARVDDAALRVLSLKAELYPDPSPAAVIADPERATAAVGRPESREIASRVARSAVTRLRALDRPQPGDRIVVVADFDRSRGPTRLSCRSESCGMGPDRAAVLDGLGTTLVDATIVDRYGPGGTNTLRPDDVSLVTFCQLRQLLAPSPPTPTPAATGTPGSGPTEAEPPCDPDAPPEQVRAALLDADWIVFAFADLGRTELRDLRGLLLPQVGALVRTGDRTRIGALALGPPYYVDQTSFFELDAMIATYSKVPAAVDAGIAALFGDLEPTGSLPVSYEDAGLVLADQLAPDPGVPIPLRVVAVAGPRTELPAVVELEIGPVLDHNGHPVPDGTTLAIEADPPEALGSARPEARTAGAVARLRVRLLQGGRTSLVAIGEGAASSPVVVDVEVPPTPTAVAATATTQAPGRDDAVDPEPRPLGLIDLLSGLACTVVVAALAPRRGSPAARKVSDALWSAAGGLAAYLALGLLAQAGRIDPPATGLAPAAAALAGAGLGLVAARIRARGVTARG